jgi:hypothetical protein
MRIRHLSSRWPAILLVVSAALGAPGCGGEGATKAGGQKAGAAKEGGQKGGSVATGAKSSGQSAGSERDGLACDASAEGVGWCDSDAEIVFCSEGSWWLLDCTAVTDGAYCGYDEELNEVDCYVEE